MYKTAYNPTDSPVVVDGLGRIIGGKDWGTIETTDGAAQAAIDANLLSVVDRPGRGADLNDQASAAFDETERLAGRSKAFDGLDREQLFGLAVESGLQDEDDDTPYKADLVARLTHSDVDPPEKTSGGRNKPAAADKTEES